jgi:hypothetical protein
MKLALSLVKRMCSVKVLVLENGKAVKEAWQHGLTEFPPARWSR